MELLNKRERELKDLKKSQPLHIAKNEKACLEGNTNGVIEQLFYKKIRKDGNFYRLNQLSQQNQAMEMGLDQQKHCQVRLKETEQAGQNEGRLLDFLDPTGPDQSTFWLQDGIFFKTREEEPQSNSDIRLPLPSQAQKGKAASTLISKGLTDA